MEELVLAVLCIAVIGLAFKLSRLTDARAALASLIDLTQRLEHRLANLERQVASQSVTPVAPRVTPAPAEAASYDTSDTQLRSPSTEHDAPVVAHLAPPLPLQPRSISVDPYTPIAARRAISLEERLGQNWLSKIGIVLVVLGVATFLGYKLVTLGPLGKSLTGLASALILLIGGLLLERKPSYRIFARAGIGGGWALLFFTTFALYHVNAMQVLTSQAADLILMALVAAAMVWHSLRYKSQVVTALAFLLAFATVGLSDITLFSLVAGALLAVALVFVAAREFWFELGLAGLCGVYVNHFLWLLRVLPGGGQLGHPFPDLLPSIGLLFFYWLLFRAFYVLRVPPAGSEAQLQQFLAALTAILNSVGLLALLKYQSSHPEWSFRVLLLLGLIELFLAFLARPRSRTAFVVLASIASALLLAAIPFHFDGSNWTLLWLFESEALFIAGILIHEKVLRRLGLIAGLLTGLQVLLFDTLPVLINSDTKSHASTAISLFVAAVLFWFNSELAPGLWPSLLREESPIDRAALTLTSYMAALTAAALLYLELRPEFLAIAWSSLTLVLIAAAWLLRRESFTAQAMMLLAAAALRCVFYNLFEIVTPTASFWSTRATTVSIASAIMFLCLPIAFAIRRDERARQALSTAPKDSWRFLLAHPEQAFFFVPYALLTVLIAFELRTGMITLGWIALGLVAFLAALPIGERSYRLAGLGLLLLGLAKIVLVDIWSLSTTDRILTLIVTGAAMLLVSFLYSRYRETILKFL